MRDLSKVIIFHSQQIKLRKCIGNVKYQPLLAATVVFLCMVYFLKSAKMSFCHGGKHFAVKGGHCVPVIIKSAELFTDQLFPNTLAWMTPMFHWPFLDHGFVDIWGLMPEMKPVAGGPESTASSLLCR